MTHPRTNATPPDPAQDADRLGDAWDALVAGHRPTVAEADAELMAVVGQLSAEAAPIRPTLAFRNSLRETLMHASPTAAPPPPTFRPLPSSAAPSRLAIPLVQALRRSPAASGSPGCAGLPLPRRSRYCSRRRAVATSPLGVRARATQRASRGSPRARWPVRSPARGLTRVRVGRRARAVPPTSSPERSSTASFSPRTCSLPPS